MITSTLIYRLKIQTRYTHVVTLVIYQENSLITEGNEVNALRSVLVQVNILINNYQVLACSVHMIKLYDNILRSKCHNLTQIGLYGIL